MIRPGAFFGTSDNAIVNQISEGSGQYLTSINDFTRKYKSEFIVISFVANFTLLHGL